MVLNEIKYLRILKNCENIVQLDYVYIDRDKQDGSNKICLVMRYAKYGSILNYLQSKQKFTEEDIKTIME